MSAALLLFAVLAVLALGGAFFLLAEGRRTISLAAGYLGIGLALSGIMLLGGGLFAAIFLFVLSMATAVVLLFFSVYLQGRGEVEFDPPAPARLLGKLAGSVAMLGVVVLLAGVLPAAESGAGLRAATSDISLLGLLLFGQWDPVMWVLGLIFLVAAVGSLALVFGRSAE